MHRYLVISALILLQVFTVSANQLIFHETFEDQTSLQLNNCISCNVTSFVPGFQGNAAYFSYSSKYLSYPVQDNINKNKGTVSFWVRVPTNISDSTSGGLFDYGGIGDYSGAYLGIFRSGLSAIYVEFRGDLNKTTSFSGYGNQISVGTYPRSLQSENWTLITMTWKANNDSSNFIKLYINGQYRGERTATNWSFNPSEELFYVGTSGFYGTAKSEMDELKIYDYDLSSSEILTEYSSFFNFTCSQDSDCGTSSTSDIFCSANNLERNTTTYICVFPNTENAYCSSQTTTSTITSCSYGCSDGSCNTITKPQSTGDVYISGRKLYVDGEEYKVKSLGYAPVPIGNSPNLGYDITLQDNLRDRDFPLIRGMHANTIRTWGKVGEVDFLDDAWNNGNQPIRVIIGYWMGPEKDYTNPAVRNATINDFKTYVTKYKDHPAVLVWAIGNEENYFYANGNNAKLEAYISLVDTMAREAYQIEGEDYHPVVAVTLELPGQVNTAGNDLAKADDQNTPYIDIWGVNHYPGKTFGAFFDTYEQKSNKPLLITEYGIDALNNTSKQEYELIQSEWDASLWREIINSDVTIGGSIMEYNDEYWKSYGSNINTQDYGGYATTSHPDGYANEEWWGIMRTVKNSSSSLNIVQPRLVYYSLREEFSEGISCFSSSDCGTPEYIGNLTCSGNNVLGNLSSYICINPGTKNSACMTQNTINIHTQCKVSQFCSSGACNQKCIDSDNGRARVKGFVQVYLNGEYKTKKDVCASSTVLYEYNCNSLGKAVKKTVYCRCSRARCI